MFSYQGTNHFKFYTKITCFQTLSKWKLEAVGIFNMDKIEYVCASLS